MASEIINSVNMNDDDNEVKNIPIIVKSGEVKIGKKPKKEI
jgi:hypothetical protein